MVQQKIVLKVEMSCENCRTQVLKIAAIEKGVTNVSIQPEKDQLEVIGNGIDSVCLTMSLRKKLKHVQVISIEEVKPKAVEEKKAAAIVPLLGHQATTMFIISNILFITVMTNNPVAPLCDR